MSKREELERDGDTLFDAATAALDTRDRVYALQTVIEGVGLDDIDLSEREDTVELRGQLQAMAELAGDVLATIEDLEREVTRLLDGLTDNEDEDLA